jgi:hypothetical protein
MTIKVQMIMTIEQARLMMRAMDLYMRILMGQFEELEHLFCFYGEEGEKFKRDPSYRCDLEHHLKRARGIVYPTLSPGAYWGITGEPCPKDATIIYDMYKSLDHDISWYLNPKGDWTVNYDKPMHWYKDLPLPEVRVFEE